MIRNFHKCTFCNERFVTESDGPLGSINGAASIAGLHACPEMVEVASQWRNNAAEKAAKYAGAGTCNVELMIAEAGGRAIVYFAPAKQLNYKPKAKADKCGPKCWGAKKEDCACECRGLHHGHPPNN